LNYQLQAPVPATIPAATTPARPELTLTDIWKSLRRRWKAIAITLGIFFVLAVLVCIFMKPRYEAVEVVQIQKDSSGPLGLEGAIGEGAMPTDAIDYNITLQTQAEVLMSEGLAIKTIEDLGMEKTYDFQSKFSPLGWVLGLIAPKVASDPAAVPLQDAPLRRSRAARIFAKHLTVKVTDGTRLISVKYSDPDPKIAHAVVDHLVQGLIEYNFQSHFAATSQASKFLGDQLADLKKAAEDSQTKVSQLQKDAEVFSTGDTDPNGHVISVSVVLSRLQDLNTALSAAQTNRILKEAIYRSVESGGADSISGLAGNMVNGASPEVVNSLSVIQALRTQQAQIESTIAQDSAKYGPEFPHMQQLQSQLADVKRSLHDEVDRIAARAKSDYTIALQTENNTRSLYQEQKQKADTLNSKAIDYTVAKQEADQNRGLYDDMYRRLKEAGAIEGLRSSNVVVMDPGGVPGRPKTPNIPIYLGVSIVAGTFMGSLLALFIDSKDNSVQEISQVEFELGVHPVGILPAMARPRHMRLKSGDSEDGDSLAESPFGPALRELNPFYVEALRTLRTSILNTGPGAPPQVMLVTSCQPNVGKTSLSLNFAAVLGQQGHKVLVVECDMRRPSIKTLLGISPEVGLSTILTDTREVIPVLPMPDTPGVSILAAGSHSESPAELLGSERMKSLVNRWRKEYDFVILDSPPALVVTDPVILASLSDMVLLVVRHGQTTRQAMTLAYRLLASASKAPSVGVVVNGVREGSSAFYEYYGYKISPYGAEAAGGFKNA
jgi:polysaccharide biosynthesis transport protein